MDHTKLKRITVGVILLAVLLIAVMLRDTMHRSGNIILPDTDPLPEESTEDAEHAADALHVVEVTPETVQDVIATLKRPAAYRRTVTVEQFWGSGSGTYETVVTVSEPWTRTDRTMPDGRVRHSITGEDQVYIWYNNDKKLYTSPSGGKTADHEQTIPTYEDILELPVEQIRIANYRTVSDLACIYVEAESNGYTIRYWVQVETGLLVASEKLLDGKTIYRMGALKVDQSVPSAADFLLPNGVSLIS